MKKKPLRRKSFFSLIFVVLMALIIGLSISFAFSNKFYISAKQRALKSVYRQVNAIYEELGPGESIDSSDYAELSTLCEENTISLLILSSSGTVEYSFGDSQTLKNRINDILFSRGANDLKVVEEKDGYVLQMSGGKDDGTGYIELWGVLSVGKIVIARSSYAGINNTSRMSLTFLVCVFVITFLFIGIMVVLVLKPYTDSLGRLLVLAEKANKGEFEAGSGEGKAKERRGRNDEIGMLGENITELSRKLEKTISELKTSNLKLENELKGRIEQDEANRKYMSDVSHELKTPIALISGYAEGLKEGITESPEERDYYCEVIMDEAEKMNVMIKKLATLNQLENGAEDISLERFNVTEVIDGFLNSMAIVIEEKGAEIYFDNSSPVYVWSDEFLVEEVLMNYFNNAMNHMDDNKTIRINAVYIDEKTVRLTVFNSGGRIPEEEQSKIWGKFYKVDKARTRSYGGSGLGLSIVKAVADSLDQRCGVYNEEDGVSFWINLEAAAPSEGGAGPERSQGIGRFRKLKELPVWKKAKNTLSLGGERQDNDKEKQETGGTERESGGTEREPGGTEREAGGTERETGGTEREAGEEGPEKESNGGDLQ